MMESSVVSEDTVELVVESITKLMQDNVIVEGNQVVGARIGDIDLKLPVTETMRRCSVAKEMKVVAESAWQSPRFQKFISNVAGMVSNSMIREAVAESTKFLKEYQEFSLLNLTEMESLVSDALATMNQYNPVLVENAALLLYKTNTQANKKDILGAWEKTARVANDSTLLEDVYNLSKSEDFNNDYQEFLHKVIVEGTKIPEDFLEKFLLVLKKMLKDEIESMEDREEEGIEADETSSTINDLLGNEEESMLAADVNKSNKKVVLEEANPALSKYKKALEDIESMIVGVEAGDPEQVEAATNMIQSIDVDNIMTADTLESYGQEEEIGDLGAGDIADAADGVSEEGEGLEGEGLEGEEDLGLGDLGGDLGGDLDLGEEGEGEGLEGLGDLEGEGLGEEGEGEETFGLEEEPEEEVSLESKDSYSDYAISEDQDINDEYGIGDAIEESMDEVVADLKNLFESEGKKPWEQDEEKSEEVDKEDEETITETDDEDGEDVKEEGKEDIKNKEVISGTEGVKAAEGAAKDTMPKDNGGKIPGEQKLKDGCGCTDHSNPGNKGTDSDCKEEGDPLKRDPKNDADSATLEENKKPTFGKGPFKRVK